MNDQRSVSQSSIDELASALSVAAKDVEECLLDQNDEFYDIEYYLRTELHWYRQSSRVIGDLIARWMPTNTSICIDVGCGVGLYANKIAATLNHGAYLGVDLSRSGLKLARRLDKTALIKEFICADALFLPLNNSSVDLVFCSEVIEHLKEPQVLLEEIGRVLRPGGKLILTTTTFQYYIAHVLVIWGYRDVLQGHSLRRFFSRLWYYLVGYCSPADRARFMWLGLERKDHLQAFMLSDLRKILSRTPLVLDDYIYFNVKDIFPSSLFSPVNQALRFLFRQSRIYGPNVALLCSKP